MISFCLPACLIKDLKPLEREIGWYSRQIFIGVTLPVREREREREREQEGVKSDTRRKVGRGLGILLP